MDRERLERCPEQVSAYRASSMKARVWTAANAVALLSLQSWCAHATRWQARLGRVEAAQPVRPGGFVAARVAAVAPSAAPGPNVRPKRGAGAGRVEMHWLPAHARDRARWLRESTR
jgi:hypothetical protein